MDAQPRLPAIEKNMDEINPAKDIHVRVLGTLIGVKEGTMVVDDGTGSVSVLTDNAPNVREHDLVRVLGHVHPTESGFEIRSEFVENINSLDLNSYKKLREAEKRFGW